MVEAVATTKQGAGLTESLRLPPHSVEAEQSVLGGVMLDPSSWDQIADAVGADTANTTTAAINERNETPRTASPFPRA